MPKLPPPPRIAQNRSGFSVALALQRPAVGGDDVRRDQVVDRQPDLRLSQPKPPPRVRPATPVVELMPSGVASPKRLRRRVELAEGRAGLDARGPRSPRRRGPPFIGDRSIISPPSHDRVAGDVVATAAHGDREIVLAREANGVSDVVGMRHSARSARAGGRSSRSRSCGPRRIPPIREIRRDRAAHARSS